jgi:glutaredoxin-related protein
LPEYPFQQGSSLNAAGINYDSLKAMQAMKRLKELENLKDRNSTGGRRFIADPRRL